MTRMDEPVPPGQQEAGFSSSPGVRQQKPNPSKARQRPQDVAALIQAQLDHCRGQGVGVRRLGSPVGRVQLSLPFAGRKVEVLAIVHHPAASATARAQLDDDDQDVEEEEEQVGPRGRAHGLMTCPGAAAIGGSTAW